MLFNFFVFFSILLIVSSEKPIARPIWESLIIIRDREFHHQFEVKDFSWYIPDVNELNGQLAIADKLNSSKTLFQRMGFKDEDGSEISLTHMGR
jgi:hypothetical protein